MPAAPLHAPSCPSPTARGRRVLHPSGLHPPSPRAGDVACGTVLPDGDGAHEPTFTSRRIVRIPIGTNRPDDYSSLRGDAVRQVAVDDPLTRHRLEWGNTMSTFLWVIFASLYLLALVMLGITTLRKDHTWLFVFGIFLPFLWIVGALVGRAPRATGTA